MSNSGEKRKAGWAALWMLAALPSCPSLADEGGSVAPLDLAPMPAATGSATDLAPTSALKALPVSKTPSPSVSKLDLSPFPGAAPELPPDSPSPSPFTMPVVAPAASEIDAAPTLIPAPPTAAAPPTISEAAPGTPTGTLPNPAAETAPEQPKQAAETIADVIHAKLDRFSLGVPHRSPLRPGDWNAARKAIAAVYAERAYLPIWVDGDHFSERAKSTLSRLSRAGEDGLDLSALTLPESDWVGSALQAQAEADLSLSAAVVAYAMQASGARIIPSSLSKDVSAKPEVADAGAALRRVGASADPDATLADFNPPQAAYHALRLALAAARPRPPEATALRAGPELKVGMSDPRVPLIRARFGLGAATDASGSQVYDVRVASAVAAFQRVHGLKPNGSLTEATANVLDSPKSSELRASLLIANMEMWRWEPRDMGEVRVEVNVPNFSLKLMSGDEVVHRARVIVGKPDTATPIFSNAIRYMLLNPVWHVPDSIIKKEMAPHFASDPNYFARRGYKVSYVGDKLVVEQPPGEANALGHMLFLFPNEHAVYLHDTPQRALFSAPYRALSHGCVRVEDPTKLAEILMGGAGHGWTGSRIRSLIGDKERTISLPTPVPVHLEYFTEFVDEGGALHEVSDLYGLTGKVAAALAGIGRN